MRTIITTFSLLLLLIGSAPTIAANFKQGEHYFSLNKEVSKTQQITEYFSFYCPACFRQEPFMKELKALLPEPKSFKKVHVDAMPGRVIEREHMLSKALATARILNVEEKVNAAIFNYIHVNKADFTTDKDIRNLFVLAGITKEAFDKTYNSFKVKMEAKKMSGQTKKLRNKGYSSVPTIVINNNYIPNIKSITSMQEYKDLVQHLLQKR